MRAACAVLTTAMLLLGACFGGGGDDADRVDGTETPTATAELTPTATPTLAPTASATPTLTVTVTPSATPDEAAEVSVCINDPNRGSAIDGLEVGAQVFADELANVREDHSIDAARVAQVRGSTLAAQVVDGPWCNETFTWWLVEAEGVSLADDAGAIDGSSLGNASGWIAEIDQHGLINLGAVESALGESPAS